MLPEECSSCPCFIPWGTKPWILASTCREDFVKYSYVGLLVSSFKSNNLYFRVSLFHESFIPCIPTGELSLAIIFLLKGKLDDFVSWYGIKCSSWTQVNVGTSTRCPCASLGDILKISVREANQMLERRGVGWSSHDPQSTNIYTRYIYWRSIRLTSSWWCFVIFKGISLKKITIYLMSRCPHVYIPGLETFNLWCLLQDLPTVDADDSPGWNVGARAAWWVGPGVLPHFSLVDYPIDFNLWRKISRELSW